MRRLAALAFTGALLVSSLARAQEARVAEREMAWARPGGVELTARIYEPVREGDAPAPVLVDVHGGIWFAGDRSGDAVPNRGLAEAGFLVVAIDFRQGPEHQHPSGTADVAAAVRWVRLNAPALRADPDNIGLIGASSGGHLALLAGVRPNVPEHLGTPILNGAGEAAAHDDIDASVDYVVALWPVSDPHARFRYAQRARIEVIQQGTRAYFPDEAAMLDASVPRVVTAGEATALPPVLVVQPGMDGNVPAEITFDLLRAYQARDGKIEYAFFPGQPHAFGVAESPETDDMVAMIADFARRRMRDPSPP